MERHSSDRYARIEIDKSGTDAGIDHLAYDTKRDEFVVIESKYGLNNDPARPSKVESTRTLDSGREVVQMSDDWIQDAFEKEIRQADGGRSGNLEIKFGSITDPTKRQQVRDAVGNDFRGLQTAIDRNNYNRKLVWGTEKRGGRIASRREATKKVADGDGGTTKYKYTLEKHFDEMMQIKGI